MFVKSLFADDVPPIVANLIWNHPVIRTRHRVWEGGYGHCRFVEATTFDDQTKIRLDLNGPTARFVLCSERGSFHYGLLLETSIMLHRMSGLGSQPIYLDEAQFPVYVELVGPKSGTGYAIAWPSEFHKLIEAVRTWMPGQHEQRQQLLRNGFGCSRTLARQLYQSFTGVYGTL